MKKILSLILSLVMLLTIASTVTASAASSVENQILSTAKPYAFRYSSGSEHDYDATMYYTDKYFLLDPTATSFNKSFAAATYCLTLASFGSNETEYEERDINVKNLMKKIGFKNYKSNKEFRSEPTADSIGVAVANKKMKLNGKKYTVIAVGIRGAGYEGEWGGNFTLGRIGQHSDFAFNKDKVISFLKKYIKKYNISGNVKIWLTGYSRGGAVGNLVAGAIDDGALKSTGIKTGKKDLYAMLFEPPAGGMLADNIKSSKYNNILNFYNPYDIIPLVAMKEYGFGRYGRTFYYPSVENDKNYSKKKKQMLKVWKTVASHEEIDGYDVDEFQMYKFISTDGVIAEDTDNNMKLPTFEKKLVHWLASELVPTRDVFVDEYQNGFRVVMQIMFAGGLFTGQADAQEFFDCLVHNLEEKSMLERLSAAANDPVDPEFGLQTVFHDLIVETMNDAEFNSLAPADLAVFVRNVVHLLVKMFMSNPDYTVTVVKNLMKFVTVHYPSVSFAWLQLWDPLYS